MRNLVWFLTVVGGALLTFFVLLPVVGFVLMLALVILALLVLAYFALPLLMKLPWFRDRIHVDETIFGKAIRFGSRARSRYEGRPRQENPDDVIDVEGREIPDKE